ncbi:hypothetical protein KXS15_13690 [Sinorhizobium meliloti]|uniref:hypothetical protein n=1 Tax=Rhizobium meliloti TaxID=382 RepID=UPI003F167F9E
MDLYSQTHSLMHINRHYDALRVGVHTKKMPDLRTLSADDYLADLITAASGSLPRFRWDNYLSIYLAKFQKQLQRLRLVTIRTAIVRGSNLSLNLHPPDELPENMDFWLEGDRERRS